MATPHGVLAVLLCSSLFGSCQAMALNRNTPTTKAWSQVDAAAAAAVSQVSTDRIGLSSDLPLWTSRAGGAKMDATSSPFDLWMPLSSVSAEETAPLNADPGDAIAQPSSESHPAQSAKEEPERPFHLSDLDSQSFQDGTAARPFKSQLDWADEEGMPDLHFVQTAEGDSPADVTSPPSVQPVPVPSSTESEERSLIDSVDKGTVAPARSSGTSDLGTSISASSSTRQSNSTRPTAREVTKAGGSDIDATTQGEEAEVRTTAVDGGSLGLTPTKKTEPRKGVIQDDSWSETDTLSESSLLPDCNAVSTGICNVSVESPLSAPPPPPPSTPTSGAKPTGEEDLSSAPFPPLASTPSSFSLLLVPLRCDWTRALAAWGLAWEGHVYGLGCVFALVAFVSAVCLLCLPLRWPSGCALFGIAHFLQLLAGGGRSFLLFYDPYGQRERLPAAVSALLHETAFPCLTSAFGAVLLLLSARSRTQLLPLALLQRSSCALACLLLAHVGLALGSVGLGVLLPNVPRLALVPPGAFVALALLLSVVYLLFYCYARADAKHIYRLSEASPDRDALPRSSKCPFSEAGVWERAAGTGVFAALFLLACGALRLYTMLLATGVAGEGAVGLPPWPWWGLQFSMRVCEAGVCLTLALIITHPLLCCGGKSGGSGDMPKLPCWPGFSWRSGGGDISSSAKPSLGWSLRSSDKKMGPSLTRKESESVPLYTLADQRLTEADGLDLHYPGTPTADPSSKKQEQVQHAKVVKTISTTATSSFGSLDGGVYYTDSTVDLRPPSPIDLRRSIDEALFSDSMFSRSLFSSSRLSLSTRSPPDGQPCRGPAVSAEPALYRTSSCGDVDLPATADPSRPAQRSLHSQRGGGAWRGSSSASLCGGHCGGHAAHSAAAAAAGTGGGLPLSVCCGNVPVQETHGTQGAQGAAVRHPSHRRYPTMGSTSSRESLCDPKPGREHVDEDAVQAEFVHVCRQIDALSISSDTIEL